MKRSISIFLTLALILSLMAGCGSSGQDASKTTDTAAASNVTAAATTEDKSPITFTIFDQDGNSYYDNYESDVSKKIQEETGVTLKFEYPVGDAEQKVSLMSASGEYPDMMYITHQRDMYIKQGAFIKLDELIEQYGPNIKKMFGTNLKRLRYSLEDESIYNLGTFGVDIKSNRPETGFSLQIAMLKELGYPKIETLQDVENAIKTYIAKYPTIDGKPTIGLSLLADDWRFIISIRNPSLIATGKPDDGDWLVNPDTGEAKIAMRSPEIKEYFRWLNHMNDIGLLDQESFVQKYDQYLAKIGTGRVLGLADANWEFSPALDTLRKDKKDDRGYVMFPAQLTKDTKSQVMKDYGFRGDWGISITDKCKDPVRAMKFLDYMCTEKSQILFNWGIEGKHYKVENGQRVFLPEVLNLKHSDTTSFVKTTGIGLYNARPWPFFGWGAKDSTGQMYSAETVDELKAGYSEPLKEALKAYGAELEMDLYPKTEDLPKSKYGVAWQLDFEADSPNKVIMQKYSDLYHKRIPQSVLAKPADFDKVWDNFQQELIDIGIEKTEAEFTKILQTRMKLYND